MTVRLLHGDCLARMRELQDASVDSVVTDPPYGLAFMGKRWDHDVPSVAVWTEVLRVLRPGGHLLSFGGTRTYHRLACAIEDAGFEIRDQIGWAFGSGFPKSHNGPWGGTALKPAWEPICMARKPLIGTVEANHAKHGTGALNIDGCRVETDARPAREARRNEESDANSKAYSAGLAGSKAVGDTALGRWPANLIHDGSDEVLAAFPQARGMQGALTGDEPSDKTANAFGKFATRSPSKPRGDAGSAARFFYCAKASRSDRNDGLHGLPEKPLLWSSGEQSPGTFQSANTRRAAQNNHPTVKPTDLMRYLCRLVTPPRGTVLDPFMGSGSTGRAAELEGFDFIGIELDAAYLDIAGRRIAAVSPPFAEVA